MKAKKRNILKTMSALFLCGLLFSLTAVAQDDIIGFDLRDGHLTELECREAPLYLSFTANDRFLRAVTSTSESGVDEVCATWCAEVESPV